MMRSFMVQEDESLIRVAYISVLLDDMVICIYGYVGTTYFPCYVLVDYASLVRFKLGDEALEAIKESIVAHFSYS